MTTKPNQNKKLVLWPLTTMQTLHIKNNLEAKVNTLKSHDKAPANYAQNRLLSMETQLFSH